MSPRTPSPTVEATTPLSAPPAPSITRTTSVPPTTNPTTAVVAPPGTTITSAGSQYGEMPFDETGQAIYLFDLETTSTPACYDDCTAAWPPVLTDGAPVAAGGAQSGLLGTTPRTDGSSQVTYAGHPLYLYAHEGKDEVRCHDVPGFGGVWFALSPSGVPPPS